MGIFQPVTAVKSLQKAKLVMTVGKHDVTTLRSLPLSANLKVGVRILRLHRIKTNVGGIVNLFLLTVMAFVVRVRNELA